MKLTKESLIESIAEEFELSKAKAGRIVNKVFQDIIDSVKDEGATFIGFGSFAAVDTKERIARNPSTGENITVPAGKRIKFKVGKKFKDAVK